MGQKLKKIIREQLEKKQKNIILRVMARFLNGKTFKDNEDDYTLLLNTFNKTIKILNLNLHWKYEQPLREYLVSCFIQSGHSNIKDPSFVLTPKKNTFKFDGFFSYSESGTKEINGTMESYTKTDLKMMIEEEGYLYDYVVDGNVHDSQAFDIEINYEIVNSLNESKENGLTKKDEKLNHYIEYYKNLSPDGFSVIRGENNEIIIKLPK